MEIMMEEWTEKRSKRVGNGGNKVKYKVTCEYVTSHFWFLLAEFPGNKEVEIRQESHHKTGEVILVVFLKNFHDQQNWPQYWGVLLLSHLPEKHSPWVGYVIHGGAHAVISKWRDYFNAFTSSTFLLSFYIDTYLPVIPVIADIFLTCKTFPRHLKHIRPR
jgi:hypothetical protein